MPSPPTRRSCYGQHSPGDTTLRGPSDSKVAWPLTDDSYTQTKRPCAPVHSSRAWSPTKIVASPEASTVRRIQQRRQPQQCQGRWQSSRDARHEHLVATPRFPLPVRQRQADDRPLERPAAGPSHRSVFGQRQLRGRVRERKAHELPLRRQLPSVQHVCATVGAASSPHAHADVGREAADGDLALLFV